MFEIPTRRGSPAPARASRDDDDPHGLIPLAAPGRTYSRESREEGPPRWKGAGSDRWEALRSPVGDRRGSYAPGSGGGGSGGGGGAGGGGGELRTSGYSDTRRSFSSHGFDRWAKFHDSRHDPDRGVRRQVSPFPLRYVIYLGMAEDT